MRLRPLRKNGQNRSAKNAKYSGAPIRKKNDRIENYTLP